MAAFVLHLLPVTFKTAGELIVSFGVGPDHVRDQRLFHPGSTPSNLHHFSILLNKLTPGEFILQLKNKLTGGEFKENDR